MKKIKSDEKGFTLIEMIVTLVLMGITTVFAGMWIVSAVNGYTFTKMNANTTQKAQLAMTRLVKEFTIVRSVTAATGSSITYTRTDPTLLVPVSVVVSWSSGNPLQLNVNNAGNNTLTDSVSGFKLAYCNNPTGTAYCGDGDKDVNSCSTSWSTTTSQSIRIDLTLTGANDTTSTFTQCVTPRNL